MPATTRRRVRRGGEKSADAAAAKRRAPEAKGGGRNEVLIPDAATAATTKTSSDASSETLRVLLATDDDATRAVVATMLRELGALVVEASTGEGVLKALKDEKTPCDMILTDILMPEVDGVALSETMRTNKTLKEVPVVIMSTVDERDACAARFQDAGAVEFLTKPVSRVELKESLAHTRLQSHASESADRGSGGAGSGGVDGKAAEVGSGSFHGSAKSSLTKLTAMEKAMGSGSGQNDSGSDNAYNGKKMTRRAEAAAIDRWASQEGGSGDCGSGGSGQGTGSGSGSHEGSGSGQRDPNDNVNFRGLSIQLIKAHGGATTMLELSLPNHTEEHVVVRRSNSRSAFHGFQKYLKDEKKDSSVQMMSVGLTKQHQSFYEASSMMPPGDFAKFFGPILPPPPPMPPMDVPVSYVNMNAYALGNPQNSASMSEIGQSYQVGNPFYNVLQKAADHPRSTKASEHRAEAIRRFLKKRKERNFDKKVRYASRQKLAEARPRVRGQFIRNTETTDNGSNDAKNSNTSAARGEVEGAEIEEYGHGSNTASKDGSKEGSRSSSREAGQGFQVKTDSK